MRRFFSDIKLAPHTGLARGVAGMALLGLLASATPALAQWVWLEKDGRKVFSDRAPPTDVPAQNILKQPASASARAQPGTGSGAPIGATAGVAENGAAGPTASASAGAASAATSAAAKPVPGKPTGTDKELEARKKKAEQDEADKRKAEQERLAQTRRENCERARTALAALDTGLRVRRANAKGELEYLSDEQRAQERRRLQDMAARECGAGSPAATPS